MARRFEHLTEPELKAALNEMGRNVTAAALAMGLEKPHFVLLVFNDPKVAQYVASVERSTIVEALREAADRLERRQDVTR